MKKLTSKYSKALILFLCVVSTAEHLRAKTHVEKKGVGLSFYFNQQVDQHLAQLLLENIEHIGDRVLFVGKVKYPFPALSRSSCKLHVWKEFEKATANHQNRMECDLDFEDYSRARMRVDLSSETIIPLGFVGEASQSPELSFEGPFAEFLAKMFREKRNAKGFLKFKDLQSRSFVALGAEVESSSPYLACSESKEDKKAICQLMFNNLAYSYKKLSLGHTAKHLIQAMCSGLGSAFLSGTCPTRFLSLNDEECFYEGMWVPHGVWGAVSADAKITCSYSGSESTQLLSYDLGVIVVSPWGSRFSDPSIQVKGPGLAPLYKALKNYSLNNKDQKIIEYTLLPGRPPWSMEWISVQRFDSDKDLVSSFGCEERDVSTDSYYQTPTFEGGNIGRSYSCSFHTHYQRIKN